MNLLSTQAGRWTTWEKGTPLPDIDWSVISSGVDFLESAVDHLAEGAERDLRYAALHLSTAIETLLKAQLARADWVLVFENAKKADPVAYQTGAFKSVGIAEAVRRLRRDANSSITDEEMRRIKAVADLRNRIAHFALHGEEPLRTEATIARGLDVLLHFIDREFVPTADVHEANLIDAMLERARGRLGKIQALIRERMQTLQPTLDAADVVLSCPGCTLGAYVLGDGEPGGCLYCLHHPSGDGAAAEYVTTVLGESSYYETVKDGGRWPVHGCVECGAEAFVATTEWRGVFGDETTWVCFTCGYSCGDADVGQCVDCGIMTFRPADSLPVCHNCAADFRAD